MKEKKVYFPSEFAKLMEYCLLTTNLGEKAESILRSIYVRYICNAYISSNQYQALHNIAASCAGAEPEQTILRNLKFAGPPEPLPMFIYEDDMLRLQNERQPIQEIQNVQQTQGNMEDIISTNGGTAGSQGEHGTVKEVTTQSDPSAIQSSGTEEGSKV